MRHIAVPGFAAAPCNGLVEEVTRPAQSPPAPGNGHRSLPIVGGDGQLLRGGVPVEPTVVWICRGCGKVWEREPLPDETL